MEWQRPWNDAAHLSCLYYEGANVIEGKKKSPNRQIAFIAAASGCFVCSISCCRNLISDAYVRVFVSLMDGSILSKDYSL